MVVLSIASYMFQAACEYNSIEQACLLQPARPGKALSRLADWREFSGAGQNWFFWLIAKGASK